VWCTMTTKIQRLFGRFYLMTKSQPVKYSDHLKRGSNTNGVMLRSVADAMSARQAPNYNDDQRQSDKRILMPLP
jgi:hypothetical protein